jgi:DNA modification methylase
MNRIEFGDCRDIMRQWAADGVKVQTCVTSPPYFGLRDYGHEGQIGLEPTPEAYIAAMVEVFRCVRDVLADDGTLWLNIADSYAGGGGFSPNSPSNQAGSKQTTHKGSIRGAIKPQGEVKAKDLIGIPWMLAFALRADGWYLRQDIIWHKPNPMPESVRDRCTKAHEYIFLLSKSERYYFDADAIKEPSIDPESHKGMRARSKDKREGNILFATKVGNNAEGKVYATRNKRSVWTVTTKPYKGAHFATFPPDLIEPCILAGARKGDIVIDPFMGSGTTAQVAVQHGRQYLGCELNKEYEELQKNRLKGLQYDFMGAIHG